MSPFVSRAQRAKFHSLVKQGKMKKEILDEWERNTKGPLPERKRGRPKSNPAIVKAKKWGVRK
ncbi:MAG: hypothetical protein A3F54_04065 [Candidatus Kerfeldbacteria bacterium RIFCSPHIGHO2_12_FULL_48_17]|uniref:Uncharacterized protein n=1 Tax=Candidatus Kerfeldbacteria bacterium RIFCSPHIGHO2_12_FULL_48_17 TaxID=1798542 RepID=A0A1G2AYV8_9BACT|nr:MAG: hypothetical protein A3F54_04065 [Candidatus Kerfeldbacteria bacterium RIFCSPHIGHO2_12_FULL_48_17]